MSQTATGLDIEAVRKQFPAIGQNADFVFADNAGGSQILANVAQRISEYLVGSNVQMADYPYAHRAAAAVANGKAAAALFAITAPENIMVGASATQLFETVSRMIEMTVLARRGGGDAQEHLASDSDSASAALWREGDEIIVSAADHEANRGAWLRLASRLGLRVVQWPMTPLISEGSQVCSDPMHVGLDPKVLATLVSERTRLVAFTASSNVLGSHWSDAEIANIVSTVKQQSGGQAFVAVDAVAFAPHRRLRPEAWGVDLLIWSWYKVFGPHVGSMYASQRAKTTLLSKLNHHFLHGIKGSMYPYQASSEQYELIASIAAVVDYLAWLGRTGASTAAESGIENNGLPPRIDYTALATAGAESSPGRSDVDGALDKCYARFAKQEHALAQQLLAFLAAKEQAAAGLVVLGDPRATAERAPTVAFAKRGEAANARSSKALHAHLVRSGQVGAQVGHMYAHALLSSVPGLDVDNDGVVRVSFVHYNTPAEVDRVCRAIATAAK